MADCILVRPEACLPFDALEVRSRARRPHSPEVWKHQRTCLSLCMSAGGGQDDDSKGSAVVICRPKSESSMKPWATGGPEEPPKCGRARHATSSALQPFQLEPHGTIALQTLWAEDGQRLRVQLLNCSTLNRVVGACQADPSRTFRKS